jgi:hypothetical protein
VTRRKVGGILTNFDRLYFNTYFFILPSEGQLCKFYKGYFLDSNRSVGDTPLLLFVSEGAVWTLIPRLNEVEDPCDAPAA